MCHLKEWCFYSFDSLKVHSSKDLKVHPTADPETEGMSTISHPSGSQRKNNSQPWPLVIYRQPMRRESNKMPVCNLLVIFNGATGLNGSWNLLTSYGLSTGKSIFRGEHFSRHMLSEAQKPNFQLLIAGFCQTFWTLCKMKTCKAVVLQSKNKENLNLKGHVL